MLFNNVMRVARHISVPVGHIAHGTHSLLRVMAHSGNVIHAANHHDLAWEVLGLILTLVAVVDLVKFGVRVYRLGRAAWTKTSATKHQGPGDKA